MVQIYLAHGDLCLQIDAEVFEMLLDSSIGAGRTLRRAEAFSHTKQYASQLPLGP
ncbi:hypothetical protein SZ00_06332 (plasmid) [Rhodococcus sp. AD45]|nr:hypothetical protein SZ00_06332 [Rhodococcus sp. AD45]